MPSGRETVLLDLNSRDFQDVFLRLELFDLKQVMQGLRRLRSLDGSSLYRHTGFQWEAIGNLSAPNGSRVYSLRLGDRIRALAYREGPWLRFISLHPDHDSAYH